MRRIKVKNKEKAQKLAHRLMKKGLVVALCSRETKSPFLKRADVVLVLEEEENHP